MDEKRVQGPASGESRFCWKGGGGGAVFPEEPTPRPPAGLRAPLILVSTCVHIVVRNVLSHAKY